MLMQKPTEALPEDYPPKININDQGKFYKRPYKMNAVGADGLTVTVAIPRDLIRRAAEKNSMKPPEFIKTHRAVIIYNSFDGAFIRFEKNE